jgi:DNA-binding NtrC family response regulator
MSQTSQTGREAILAIDDEDGFLFVLRATLESQGFTVHTASDVNEALAFYKEQLQEIGLVLLDFVMPEMTGERVFECLQQLNPDVRVILVTGHDRNVAEPMFERGLRDFIQKPFCVTDLGQRVRNAIAA